MIDISSAEVKKIIVHRVGNKIREEGFILSNEEIKKTKDLSDLLLRHYLSPLTKSDQSFTFYHEADINLNPIYTYSSRIFKDPATFKINSQSIAKHLYSASTHTKIITGELIIILFKGIIVDDSPTEALGILKIESKDSYLDVTDQDGTLQLIERSGISLEKIQKGALVFPSSNRVLAIDALNQSTHYWIESFLKVSPQSTLKACAKLGGALIKAVSSRISDANAQIEFGNRITEKINQSDFVSIGDLREISDSYLGDNSVNQIISGLQQRNGFEINDQLNVEAKSLNRYSKKAISQTKIVDGINIVVTENNTKIIKVETKKTGNKLRAVIDIEIQGE